MELVTALWILLGLVTRMAAQNNFTLGRTSTTPSPVQKVRIFCNSEDIVMSVTTSDAFNGMIYPKDLSKNSSCMTSYENQKTPVLFKLPLSSCNTMSTELTDGIEYFNTIVVQPHRKLVTNQGRGYHIRCKYQTQEKTVTNLFNITGEFGREDNETRFLSTTPITATAQMPGCYMRIFAGEPSGLQVAENVKVGAPLTMVVSLDNQEIYGLKVTDCFVRDGMNWGEQKLIDQDGCPIERDLFGAFEYSRSKTTAAVRFQAHKFPYTDSVYYQCNVKLCIKSIGGCDDVPPRCDGVRARIGNNSRNATTNSTTNATNSTTNATTNAPRRQRRDVQLTEVDGRGDFEDVEPDVDENLTIEVFSGLYVNEEEEIPPTDEASLTEGPTREEVDDPDTFCLSPRTFALGIAIAGLVLMVAVIAAILILIKRRLRGKDHSTTGSSIYSGPYTNTAYSHSS